MRLRDLQKDSVKTMTVQGRKILVVLAGNETIEFNYASPDELRRS